MIFLNRRERRRFKKRLALRAADQTMPGNGKD
jgi:hypothetical protein